MARDATGRGRPGAVRWAALGALLLLAACYSPTAGILPERVVRAGGQDVTVAGPPGFCIDERTADENRRGAVVILADCLLLPAGQGATIARVPISAVLTALVSNSGLPVPAGGNRASGLAALEEFLTSDLGVLTLGKSRQPGAISVLRVERDSQALYLLVQDLAAPATTGESPRFWRAFTEVNGRLVGLSATGFADTDPDQANLRALVGAFVQSMQRANAPQGA